MKKTPNNFLCKKCLKLMAEYDANRKKVWRLKIKQGEQVSGSVPIKKVVKLKTTSKQTMEEEKDLEDDFLLDEEDTPEEQLDDDEDIY